MEHEKALKIAQRILEELRPHSQRIEIAGSLRRKKAEVRDIEVVCIPKPYETGLFASGIALVVDKWTKVKGELGPKCKYTQRILPDGIKLDLFFAEPGNWGLIYAIRTGSVDFSHHVLATGWTKKGYHSSGGWLHRKNRPIAVPEEEDLFNIIGIKPVPPEKREWTEIKQIKCLY